MATRAGIRHDMNHINSHAPPSKKMRLLPKEITQERYNGTLNACSDTETGYPVHIVSASGQYMFSDDGTRYLDTRNNVHHVGHCHSQVIEAGTKQMAMLNTNTRFLNDSVVVYARHLTSHLPPNLCCCFFTNSGSEANDLALQIAERVTRNTEVISLAGSYHGHLKSLRCLSTHSFGCKSENQLASYVHIAPLPDTYHGKYRDPATAGQQYSDEVKDIVTKCTADGKKIAAFLCESMPSSAGQVVLPPGYLKAVYRHVHQAGGLCIADEVQSGFGRVGTHFWGYQMQDVEPDIVTLGKAIGNGHPVGAVITTKEIAENFAAAGIEYFNTYGGNPVSMAIADAVLTVIEEEGLQENARVVGDYLMTGLRKLQEEHACIGDVRGSGLFIGVELVKDRDTREPATELCVLTRHRMATEHKVLVLVDGLDSNIIEISPPMCFTVEDADYLMRSLNATLSYIC